MMPDPTPRWTILPVELEFFNWQRRVFDLLNSRPVTRRIIWCWGEPNTGETQFSQFLVDRLEGGCINFFSCLKAADLLHMYRGQGQFVLTSRALLIGATWLYRRAAYLRCFRSLALRGRQPSMQVAKLDCSVTVSFWRIYRQFGKLSTAKFWK